MAIAVGFACGAVYADDITDHPGALPDVGPRFVQGFEGHALGEALHDMWFGPVHAALEYENNYENRIFAGHDNHGAIVSFGQQAWKYRGSSVILRFDTEVSQFGFYYADVEWSDVELAFLSDADLIGSVTLADDNSGVSHFFAYTADSGVTFDAVRMTWERPSDGVGFDDVFVAGGAAIPAPSALALIPLGCAVGWRGRARRGARRNLSSSRPTPA